MIFVGYALRHHDGICLVIRLEGALLLPGVVNFVGKLEDLLAHIAAI